MEKIFFNKPFLSGRELEYIREAVESGKISGNGIFSGKCQSFFEQKYGFLKVLLTSSCTDALEMAAILCDIKPGDEVIAPSFTFVSTVNAFVLRGAEIVFCDVRADYPCIDAAAIEKLVTSRTRAIVLTHYAGIACDMDAIGAIAQRHHLFIVEDAAHAIDSYYKDRPLGGLGHFSAFSFHETKNISSGEGGMLVINDERFIGRAEILHEKGTNRSKYFRGEINKYSWVDIGSSFLPSDVTAAFLFAQAENLERIQAKRRAIWDRYFEGLAPLQEQGKLRLPTVPAYSTNNAHLFYVITDDQPQRDALIEALAKKGVMAVFHYVPLHRSEYYLKDHAQETLVNTEHFSACLLRLPLYFELTEAQIDYVIGCIKNFYHAGK
jgi:dTDP-4-amino-4,6-dideoxygalactose transaminase